MDTLTKVKEALRPGMWATSLDLSDAYHHIPMRQSARKFLCFQVGQVRYMYMVLPFGLTTAPWAFTKVVKQIKKWANPRWYVLFQIPRQLAQRSREQRDSDPHDTRPVVTVSSTRLASKRGQVRTDPITVNSVSRGAAGFGHGHSLPDGIKERTRSARPSAGSYKKEKCRSRKRSRYWGLWYRWCRRSRWAV